MLITLFHKTADYALELTLKRTNGNGCHAALLQGGFLPPNFPKPAQSTIITKIEQFMDYKEITEFFRISQIVSMLSKLFEEAPISFFNEMEILMTHTLISPDAKSRLIAAYKTTYFKHLYFEEQKAIEAQVRAQAPENENPQIPKPDQNKLKDMANEFVSKKINTFISNMIVLALMESESMLQTSNLIQTHPNLPIEALVCILKILQKNPSDLLQFFVRSSMAKEKFSSLPKDLALNILILLIESNSNEVIQSLSLKETLDPTLLLEISAKNIIAHTECVSTILKQITNQITDADPFLKNLPENFEFPENMSKNIPVFLEIMNSLILSHCYNENDLFNETQPFETQPAIDVDWEEDKNKEQKDDENIWTKEPIPHLCSSDRTKDTQANFKCHTCSETPVICEHCAALCHKGHDLVYLGKTEQLCQCSQCKNNKCVCCNEEELNKFIAAHSGEQAISQNPKNTNQKKTEKKLYHADSDLLVKTLIKLSNSKSLNNSIADEVVSHFHEDLKKCVLPKQIDHSKTVPPLIFKKKPHVLDFVGTVVNVSNDLKHVNESFMSTRRRSEVAPMNLGMTVRNGQFVMECVGCKVRILTPDLTLELSSLIMKKVVLMASVCPSDESIIAISTLSNVYILDVSDKGMVSQRCEVELVLHELGSSIFVNNVRWVPTFTQYLMITCNTFVKIYNIETDVIAPVSSFACKNSDHITSSATLIYDEKPYGIFTIYPDKIAYQDLTVETNDGMTQFSNYTNFDPHYDQLVVSICDEANLLFLSYANTLLIMRPEEIFTENPDYIKVRTNFEGQLIFRCMYPNLPIFLFVHTSTNSLFSLSFGNEGVSFSWLHTNRIPVATFAALECQMNLLSVFPLKDRVIAVSAQSGETFDVVPNLANEEVPDKSLNFEGNSSFENSRDFTVPPSFWVNASTERKGIDVRNMAQDSATDLLTGSRYIFSSNNQRKSIFVKLNDNERVIIGFRISVGSNGENHRPPWITICNRKIEVNSQRFYMFPLKPKEIDLKKTYEIRFASRNSNDINFDRLDVYSVKWKSIKSICKAARGPSDWKDGSKLTDFKVYQPEKPLEVCSLSIAYSYTPSVLSDQDFNSLVSIVYSNNSLWQAARYILSKCKVENKEVKWASAASKCIGNLSSQRKVEFWRDFQLFPQETKSIISNSIWEQEPVKEEQNEEKKQEEEKIDEGLIISAFFATV